MESRERYVLGSNDDLSLCPWCGDISEEYAMMCDDCAEGSTNSRPRTSKREREMKEVLDELFPDALYIDNGCYKDIPSSNGRPLQLDRYYPDLKLAFEYHGAQHKKFIKFFHKDDKGYIDQINRDIAKKVYCEQKGIDLIVVSHEEELSKEALEERIKDERKFLS